MVASVLMKLGVLSNLRGRNTDDTATGKVLVIAERRNSISRAFVLVITAQLRGKSF